MKYFPPKIIRQLLEKLLGYQVERGAPKFDNFAIMCYFTVQSRQTIFLYQLPGLDKLIKAEDGLWYTRLGGEGLKEFEVLSGSILGYLCSTKVKM